MASFEALSRKMDTKYGKKEEKEEKKVSSQTSQTPNSRKIMFDTLSSEMERKYNPSVEFNEYDIRSFLADSRSFLGSYQSDYEKMGYANAASLRDSRKSTWDALTERGKGIADYLEKHQAQYGDAYADFGEYLKNFRQTAADQNWSFHKANAYYAQWATEDDYNDYVAQQKDYEEKSNFDIGAGEKELEQLKNTLGVYEDLTGWFSPGKNSEKAMEIRRKYGSEDELKALISQKEQYLNQAKHIQEGITLSGVAGSGDFRQYSGYQSTMKENPSWWETGVGDTQYEWINNQNGFRDEWERSNASLNRKATAANPEMGTGSVESAYTQKGYDRLTEDEIAIYNYYYAKDGKEKAQEYLDSLQETLNYRKATEIFSDLENNTALELLFGVEAGLDQFKSGLSSLLNTEDDYIAQSAFQIASGMVREDLADVGPKILGNSLGQVGYDAITTSANMAPSILTSVALNFVAPGAGSWVGTAMMGASAAGNAYQEALNEGFDKDQARGYSLLVGGSEMVLEKVLGGISALGGNALGKFFTKNVSNADTALKMIAKRLGGSMLSDFGDEYLQEVLTPVFQNMAFDTDNEVKLFSAEALYSGILGAMTAGIMEGPSAVSGEVKTYQTGKKLQDSGISAERLAEIGNMFAADTVASQIAGKVDENTSVYTRGRLFNEIGATLTEQNRNDITEALVKEGIPREIARDKANLMAKIVEGATLTEKGIQAIEGDTLMARVVRTTIIDPNATWFQRTKGYNDALMALAQEKASPNTSRMNPAEAGEENVNAPDTMDAQKESGSESLSEADTSPAKVKNIASIQKGRATVRLEDGSEVSVRDADVDPGEGVRIETIAKIDGISSEDAHFILNTLRESPGVSAQMDAHGAKEAYQYGYYGFSQEHLTKHGVFANSLSESQRNAIYETGRKARAQNVEAKQATVRENRTVAKSATIGKKNLQVGKVHFEGDRTALTERQSASLTAMEKVAEALGVKIHVFESEVGTNGKRIGANGWYDGREIHIDLHAGAKGEGVMLFTLSHELTHHIRKWSPEKFKVLADFLMEEYGKKGVNVDGLVREQMAKAERNKRHLTYDEAFEEVVADSMETMLSDGKVLEKLKQKDKSLWQKIKDFISELAAKIRAVYDGMTPDSVEGRYVAEMKDAIEKLQDLFVEGLVDASENFQSSLTPGEEGVVADQNGDPVAYATSDGSVMLSMRTYEESGRKAYRDYLQKCVSSKQLAKAEMQEMLDGIEDIYNVCKEFKDKYAPFSSWSDAAVVRDTYGRPVFSVVTPNGDYKMNLDFSLVCKKRRTLDAVFNEMSRRGIIDDFELGQKSVVKINEIIRKYGLETACALCFVDAKRFRQASMADQFTRLYNELVLSLVPDDQRSSIGHFNFSGYETIKKVEGGIDTWPASKLDFSHLDEVMKNYGKGTVEHKAAKYIKSHAEGRKLLLRGDFMSSKGFDAVKTQNKDILKLYNSKKGTGGPKAAFGDVQYMNEIVKKAKSWTPAKAYAVGGVRIQSFSDYVPRMVFDYVQMVYDLAATKLPAHAYSKEALFVKQFGLTGIKINMSLIPAIAEGGIAPGLDANGDYVWAGESFDFETAKQIQNAEGYTENCGTICVGVSQKHIEKLLDDPDIRMVIPYHKSGLNPIVAHMNKIAEFTDYTNDQNTTVKATGSKAEKHFDFNKALHDMGEKADPRAVIQQYFDWCDDNGYVPKFATFRYHPNYYKLIEDFTLYDKDGNYVPQREVRAVFPKEGSAFGSMKELIQEGLEEDAVIEGKRGKNLSAIVDEIQRTLPKSEAEIAETQVAQADRDLEAEVKYSDRDYMDAVNRGDMETAQRMVDEAAKKAGYTIKAYHGTRAKPFTVFDRKRIGDNYGGYNAEGGAFDFSTKYDRARRWGVMADGFDEIRVMPVYLRVNKTFHSYDGATNEDLRSAIPPEATADEIETAMAYGTGFKSVLERYGVDFKTAIINAGYDSYSQYPGAENIGVYDESQIKSAEAVVYDDSGNVIPLSERFKAENDDIRYSDRDTDSVSNRSLLANAFEGVAQNDIEKQKIQEYKDKIMQIDALERTLAELNGKIRDLSFGKGPKNTEAIRGLRERATKTANRISIYDKQLLRLEASKPLQAVLEREKKSAYQRAERKGKAALAAHRERAERQQQEIRERYEASRKWNIENREKTAMRYKVQNVVKELNDLLLNESKKRHVPDSLKKAVAEALDLVNKDTVGADERAAYYANLIAKEQGKANPDQAKIDAYTGTMENILRQGEKMGEMLTELHYAYEKIKRSDDPDIANAYDPVIAGCLEELSESIGNTSLRNMTIEQLSDVYDMYRMVLTRVRDANKTFLNNRKEAIGDLASKVVGEVRSVGGDHKYRAAVLDSVKKFGWNNLKPVYAFEHIGSDTLTDVFSEVRSGEDVWAKDVTEAREYYLAKSRKYGYDKWDFKKKYRFESNSGLEFELSLEQILSLYAYSKREQAHEHLRLGGFVFDSNIETYKDGKVLKYKVNTADAHQITPDILADIISTLTKEQRGFVDEMQNYLSTTMGAKGNEVTMKMYGVKLFKEKFYFPLKSAKQFMFEQNEVSGEVRIKNSGFTNKVVAEANNSVILSNFMEVWSSHVNDMSMYHAFVLPLEDFNRVFNYNSPKSEGRPPVSVKGTIQNAYGPAAVSYVKNLITDLNGGARTDSTTGPMNWFMGRFKKGSVFASLSVVVQQPSSIARAAALVDTKYFIGPRVDPKHHKVLWDEVKRYAPVAIIKEMGYFDTNMGKSTQDFILGKEYNGFSEKMKALVTDSGYRDEVLSKAPALADELAWCSIWEAVKRETQAKNPGMDVKSDAFLKKAGQRFTEVITKTQVYDSVLARSANMRSKDTGMKMATAFMAEPTTSINMMADALLQGKRGNRKYCRAAIGAVIASQIFNSILVSFVYAGRDDDEDKTYWEKYAESLSGKVLDSLNPFTYIPFIKDIVSIVQGYDVERSDMAVISDLWNAWKKLGSDNVSAYRKVEDFAGSIAQIFGLPVKNIMRDVRGIWQTYASFTSGQKTTKAGIGYAVKSAAPKWLGGGDTSNQQQLYEAYLSGDQTQIARVESRYKDQSSINTAVRSAIKEHYQEGGIDYETAVDHLVKYGGLDEDEAFWKVEEWKYEGENDEDFAKYDEFFDAVQTGKNLKSVIKKYTDNGVKESTLKTQISEHFKPLYIEMSTAEKANIKGYLLNAFEQCGMSREEAEEKIAGWQFVADYGFNYDDRADAYISGEISAEDLKTALMEVGGKTEEDADKYIAELGFKAEYGFAWGDRGDAYKNGEISRYELKELLMGIGGKTEEEAEIQIKVYDWQNEGFDISDNAKSIIEAYEKCESAGIGKDTYYDFYMFYNESGEDGVRNSKVEECMPYIASLPLTALQKDAIALSIWEESTVRKYKTW